MTNFIDTSHIYPSCSPIIRIEPEYVFVPLFEFGGKILVEDIENRKFNICNTDIDESISENNEIEEDRGGLKYL